MNGSWFLFTARDPKRSEWVVEACVSNEGPTPIVMRDDNGAGLGPMMDEAFRSHPDLDFYGWLADDTYPQTKHWNRLLEFAATGYSEISVISDPHGLSYADDGGYLSPGGGPAIGEELSSGLCWGGDLLRAAGSWSLGFHSAYIDMAWLQLLRPLELLRYVPTVTVRHDNFRTGRRPMDPLDVAALERIFADKDRYQEWRETEETMIRQRIEAGVQACVS